MVRINSYHIPPQGPVLGQQFIRDMQGYRLLATGSLEHLLKLLHMLKDKVAENGFDIDKFISVVIFALDKQVIDCKIREGLNKYSISYQKLTSSIGHAIQTTGVQFTVDASSDRDSFRVSLSEVYRSLEKAAISMTISKPSVTEAITAIEQVPMLIQNIKDDLSGD